MNQISCWMDILGMRTKVHCVVRRVFHGVTDVISDKLSILTRGGDFCDDKEKGSVIFFLFCFDHTQNEKQS